MAGIHARLRIAGMSGAVVPMAWRLSRDNHRNNIQ